MADGAKFHEHLDACAQCRDNPFGLCAVGNRLLQDSARSSTPEVVFYGTAKQVREVRKHLEASSVPRPSRPATRERRPQFDASASWVETSALGLPRAPMSVALSAWSSGPVYVVSELANLEAPDGGVDCLQWHISISARGKRPKAHHVRRALRAFGMTQAEEDNHHPGAARHFFLVVDPARRVSCECKETDVVVTEPDGYRYSTPEGTCSGCVLEVEIGKPCPEHAGQEGG